MLNDLKYLTAYLVPVFCAVGILHKGVWLYLTPAIIFGLVPLLELVMPQITDNLDSDERDRKLSNRFFDILLWLNVPIIYSVLFLGVYSFATTTYSIAETVGLIFSLGIVAGSNGINVAHELGHRQESWERFLGKALLLPSLYMHFYIEHNYGHHQKAATVEDPASARFNENLYAFWIRSVSQQYINAWKIQKQLLKSEVLTFFSVKNDMLWYQILQLGYVLGMGWVFGWKVSLLLVAVAVVGFSLLEMINYLEHYGLQRKKKKSGRYEVVRPIHSWNSNHALGRILLYELTRHSDHHYRASKKFQVLDHHEISPQLPYGYPTMMVIALFPPLWFKIVNWRVPEEMVSF